MLSVHVSIETAEILRRKDPQDGISQSGCPSHAGAAWNSQAEKYDPDAAQLGREGRSAPGGAREKRAQEKARRRALGKSWACHLAKRTPAAAVLLVSSSDPTGSVENAGAGSDYSAPSASDTSDSEDGSSYDEDHVGGGGDDDDDDDVTALLHRMQLKGESMCPMRQYELLQRRYLRSVQEVKNYAERTRI